MGESTESIFAEHLAAGLAGEEGERAFAALLDQHPEHADELRRLQALQKRASNGPPTLAGKTTSLHRPAGPKGRAKSAFHATEGATIGDFRLVRLLGRGGMGEVWEAEQASLSRRVALKLMLPDRVNERGLDFFAREARAGGRLAHSGIVTVFGAGEDGGTHWIAMELVVGACDLRRSLDVMRDEAEVPEGYYEDIGGFIADLADALEIAHKAGVIHRDLKPANILVTADDTPKVSDFGLAKLEDEMSISSAGELLGTYYYMSPEQVATKRAGIDHRTDIFSLGVVMYEMLTLARPFEGDTTEQVAQKILWEEAPDPKAVRSRVPRDLAVICGKAMEKDPGRRYQTMAELAADLRRHRAHEPIHAKAPTLAGRLGKWARRNPGKALGGASAAAVFAVVSGLLADNIEKRVSLAEALQAAEIARAEADQSAGEARGEVKTTQEVLSFMVGLFEISDPSESRGAAITAREILDRGVEEIDAGLKGEPLIQARMQAVMGGVYKSMGLYKRAEPLLRGALNTRLEVLGEGHTNTVVSMNALASLYRGLLRYEEAEQLYRRALEAEEEVEGVDYGVIRYNLAVMFIELGRLREAEPIIREAVEERRLEGANDKDALDTTQGLASLYNQQGRHKEAEELYRVVLEGKRALLGADHPSTIGAMSGLAQTLESLQKYEEAEELCLEALEASTAVRGADHPRTFNIQNSLAATYMGQGRWSAAEQLLQSCFEGYSRTLGADHGDVLMIQQNLATCAKNQGRLDDAERLYFECLRASESALGRDHPLSIMTLLNVARMWKGQERYDEAVEVALDATERAKRTYGEDSASVADGYMVLGDTRRAQGQLEEASTYLKRALDGRARALGEDHPETLVAINHLGLVSIQLARYDQAEALILRDVELSRRTLGEDHPDTVNSLGNLGYLYQKAGRNNDAGPALLEALEVSVSVHGRGHKVTQKIADWANNTAWELVDPNRIDKETDVGLGLKLARALTDAAPTDAALVDTLAWALFANELHDEAVAEAERALELAEEDQKSDFQGHLQALKGRVTEAQGQPTSTEGG